MANFTLKDLEKYNEPDIFIIDEKTKFKVDTSAHSILKYQQFVNKYKDFQNISYELSEKADREFLEIMLYKNDASKVINEFKYKYKPQAIVYIIHELLKFWLKQTTGTNLEKESDKKSTSPY
ncbi:hypothetical protein J8A71_03220 [Mycoplasmopsis agalactiae]|uniref:hypothetical protein n=1 Tax=Mycoplasmopsis agalactiae TaxID=2110 RepID=UPI001F2585D9|nr:hypothetical protein [Mycoplasmopsis agalactiae]MCE6061890.1 hypothetical protein [Mycoplasmopsis agalactiae]